MLRDFYYFRTLALFTSILFLFLDQPSDLTKTPLKEGHQVMLMGTADVVAAPTESVVFLEDMTDVQKAAKVIRRLSFS